MMQASAADGAGFKGRANKLVDGCYGWWVGGSFAVLESLVRPVGDESLVGQEEKADAMLYDRGQRRLPHLLFFLVGQLTKLVALL